MNLLQSVPGVSYFTRPSKSKVKEKAKAVLSIEQRRVYGAESLYNFRELYYLLGTRSSYTLTASDIAPPCISEYLSEIGQYSEVADGSLPTTFLWENVSDLSQPGFPLDSRIYGAISDGTLVESIRGTVADVHASIVYRTRKRQMIIGFSGTCTRDQALRDCYALKRAYITPTPKLDKGLYVHTGFYDMYEGLRSGIKGALKRAIEKYSDVEELIVTGHSLGAAMSYLWCLDMLQNPEDEPVKSGMKITIAVFGCPRLANGALVKYWRRLVEEYRERHGAASLTELSVRTWNDGMCSVGGLSCVDSLTGTVITQVSRVFRQRLQVTVISHKRPTF